MSDLKPIEFDNCVSFLIENGAYQGRLIRLNQVVNTILGKHCYPKPVAAVVAECTVLGALLASQLKYNGLFTLQIQSNGVINLVVVDVTSDGKIRACARYDEERLKKSQELRKTTGEIEAAPHLLGGGHLVFTVDQGENTELYQGIVDLQGKNLTECALRYFKQSEQIDTDLKLFLHTPEGESSSWLTGGIMLQKMPTISTDISAEEQTEIWNEAKIFMQSLNENEIFDAELSSEEILNRLFHSNKLQISNLRSYQFGCRCSKDKLLNTLQSFSAEDIEAMIEENKITATCNFCNEKYVFTPGEVRKQ